MKNWLRKVRLWEISLAIFLGFGAYLLWTATQVTKQIGQQTSTALYNVGAAAYNFDAGEKVTFDNLNRSCGTALPCGTFADLNRTLGSVRLAAGQVTALSLFEKPQLAEINQQELELFNQTRTSLTKFNGLLDTTNTVVAGVGPLEQNANQNLDMFHQDLLDIDALMTSSDIKSTLVNVKVTSGNFADVTTDFKTKFHAVLFPPPCQGKMCWFVHSYPYLKAGVQLAEPVYYWSQLLAK